MAERKSVNKYYPPDWDPSKGSVNNYVGQHPLRDRAKKLSQGILVIRFEMPYNIWCGGCNSHIGMGVRYNAEKSKTGMYYTTPIYKFRMKCHLCPNYFEIQTDPKNHDYVILEGARRKEQRWDPKENEQIVPEDRATHKKMATDAMFKLEHGSDDHKKGRAVVMNLSNLEGRRDEWKDDYVLNKIARQKFREEKTTIKSSQESDAALLTKSSLEIPLVQEVDEDKRLAQLMKYRTVESYDEKQAQKRKEIESRPIFQSNKAQKLDISPSDNKKLNIIKKHLRTAGNKSSPFDSGRTKILSKSSLDKLSLGIRRKPEKAVSQTDKEFDVDNDSAVGISQELNESITDDIGIEAVSDIVSDVTVLEGSENRIGKKSSNEIASLVENVEGENDQFSLDKESTIDDKILVNSAKADQINTNMIKVEKTESQNCDKNNKNGIAEHEKCAGSLITADKSELKANFCETNQLCQAENLFVEPMKTDRTANAKDVKATEKESKPGCDNDMCVKATEVESFSTVCDTNTTTEGKTELKTCTNKGVLNRNYPEIKVDSKKLSLVAPYSDSDSDSTSESS